MPFTFTALTSVNPEPAIVTSAPAAALAGANEVSFGSTLKVAALNAVPPGFVTPILPVFPFAGTAAFTCVEDTVVGAVATPPKVTAVVDAMFVPLTVGAGTITSKLAALVAVPLGVTTEIGPSVAPAGTVAVMWFESSTVNDAFVPLNFTAVAPSKCDPVIATLVPASPLVGSKPSIVGGGPQDANLNEPIRVCQPKSLVVG